MVATAIIAAVGIGVGVSQANKAEKAQKRAAETQQKAEKLRQKRERRAAIRSNILASARAKATSEATGTAQSSGLTGGIGAAKSQFAGQSGFGTQISGLNARMADFQIAADKASAFSQLGFGIAGGAIGSSQFQEGFSGILPG